MSNRNPTGLPDARSNEKELRIGGRLAAAVYFAISTIYFLPAFLPGRHLFGTDYLAGGYFFFDFVSDRLGAGEIPGWVPYIYGGLPLAANPGSTFYPVRLLADLVFPVTWILPFIFVVQFFLAGLGMYLLAKELGCRSWVAFVSGVAFELTGIIASSVYAGHDGRVIVASFAPLFFFFLHRGIRTGRVAPFVGAAATLGGSLLSFQIQSNYYLLLGGAIWAVFSLIHLGTYRDRKALGSRVGFGLLAVAVGFVLASVNFLPFLDYVPLSPRGAEGGRGYDYSVSWSMPPAEIVSLAVPEQPGILGNYQGANPFKLHTEYVGALVVCLLVLGFGFARKDRYWLFFGGLALFALSIAFGGHTPLYRLYYALLPGTTRFRAPSISFFLVAMSLVIMAAITLEKIAAWRDDSSRKGSLGPWLSGILGVFIVAAGVAASSTGSGARDQAMVTGFGRFALFLALVSGALWLWSSHRLKTRVAVILLAVLTAADLWVIDRNFFATVDSPERMFGRDDVVAFLLRQPERSRVWVLPFPADNQYLGTGNYLMNFGIDQAGGEHGNQLQRYNEFVGAGEETYVDWSNFAASANFLNAANIRYVIAMVQLQIPFMQEVHRGSALVYENTAALPRAYLVGNVVQAEGEEALALIGSDQFDPRTTAVVTGAAPSGLQPGEVTGSAEITEYTPDRVVIRTTADRPALLVLSDNYYDGWRATVDGVPSEIFLTNHTFRGVSVGAGESEVVFEYHNSDLWTGFYISFGGMLLVAGYGVWLLIAGRRESAATEPA